MVNVPQKSIDEIIEKVLCEDEIKENTECDSAMSFEEKCAKKIDIL